MNATATTNRKSTLSTRELRILAKVHQQPVDWPAECARLAARVEELERLIDGDQVPLAAERAALSARFGEGNYHITATYLSDGTAQFAVGLYCSPYITGDPASTVEAATANLLRGIARRKRDEAKAKQIADMTADQAAAAAEEVEDKAALSQQTPAGAEMAVAHG